MSDEALRIRDWKDADGWMAVYATPYPDYFITALPLKFWALTDDGEILGLVIDRTEIVPADEAEVGEFAEFYQAAQPKEQMEAMTRRVSARGRQLYEETRPKPQIEARPPRRRRRRRRNDYEAAPQAADQ